jgi:hypothetical protein
MNSAALGPAVTMNEWRSAKGATKEEFEKYDRIAAARAAYAARSAAESNRAYEFLLRQQQSEKMAQRRGAMNRMNPFQRAQEEAKLRRESAMAEMTPQQRAEVRYLQSQTGQAGGPGLNFGGGRRQRKSKTSKASKASRKRSNRRKTNTRRRRNTRRN